MPAGRRRTLQWVALVAAVVCVLLSALQLAMGTLDVVGAICAVVFLALAVHMASEVRRDR